MCNLYSLTKGQQAIREFVDAVRDLTGNLPLLPGVYPDYSAPIVRNSPHWAANSRSPAGVCLRRSLPSKAATPIPASPMCATSARRTGGAGSGSTTAASCPFTSFLRNEVLPDGSRPPVWFALDESRPLAFFAGIWTRWTSVRKVKEGETTNDLFAFLTTDPNAVVAPIHPKAMPVILTTATKSTSG